MRLPRSIVAPAAAILFGWLTGAALAQGPDPEAVRRGEYLFHAGGCLGCHTDTRNNGATLAGGRALKTPFGTFYGPNITVDPEHGIGRWSEADFIRALREGVSPDGTHYYPAFPYTSFTQMTDADLRDLWAYLRTVPAVAQPNRPHDLGFPYNFRPLLAGWKLLNFKPGAFQPDPARPQAINRGAYLVQALTHCGECHTPRDSLGGLDGSRSYAGTPDGPEGERVPNITPHPGTGIGKWSEGDLLDLLRVGMMPDGDFVGGSMGEIVRNTTGKLNEPDLRAIVAYLKGLPPIENQVPRRNR